MSKQGARDAELGGDNGGAGLVVLGGCDNKTTTTNMSVTNTTETLSLNTTGAIVTTTVSAAPAKGLVGRIPVKQGFYVATTETCGDATFTYAFTPDTIWTIVKPGEKNAETSQAEFASVEDQGDGKYFLKFAIAGEPDPVDPLGEYVFLLKNGNVTLSVQDDVEVKWCKPDSVPAGVKSQVK